MLLKVVKSHCDLSVPAVSLMGFQKKLDMGVGGWVELYTTKLGFFDYFNFAKPLRHQACAQMRPGAFKCKCKCKRRIKCKCKCKCSASESNANANANAQQLNQMQMQMHLNQMQMHLNPMRINLYQMQTVFYKCVFCVQQVLIC